MKINICLALLLPTLLSSCFLLEKVLPEAPKKTVNKVYFIGIDISGSFRNGKYFDDSMDFLSHYIHSHIHGFDDLDIPKALFVSAIGGSHKNEAKTFYPIQTFKYKSIEETYYFLKNTFRYNKVNKFTDYNIFFKQIGEIVKSKKLLLKPLEIILISDGIPDLVGKQKTDNRTNDYRTIKMNKLENLSRNITVRILYTDALTGMNWKDKIPRKRLKIWSQDSLVMTQWNDPKIFLKNTPLDKQQRFFSWLKDNVDFPVRKKVVN